jgi:hypothetical protein
VHHLLLGQKFFAKLFVEQPAEYVHHESGEVKPWNNNSKVCIAWNKARTREGRTIVTGKMIEAMKAMSISVGAHPLARDFLSGQIERSFFWRDEETGIWLKWRPDAMPTSSMDFCNLKTTHSVLWPDLMRTMRTKAYYQEAALGQLACAHVLKREMHSYTYLFVESKRPNCCRDVRFYDEDFSAGRRMNRACLRIFANCLKTGQWPGPGAGNEGNERLGLSAAAREHIAAILAREGLADGVD